MSLNRGVAALGAVAVVGAATLGITLPIAAHYAPSVARVSVVAGSHWTQIAPLDNCYKGGKALSTADQAKCSASIKAALSDDKKMPTAIVPSANGNFGINVDQPITKNGWVARTGSGFLVQHQTNAYAGPLSIAQVLTTQDPTTGQTTTSNTGPILIVETDKGGKGIYGEWLLQLKVAGS
ncbi:hypothetical protein [Streptacidiphilus neutrinimicus]|uniref:hypothetical protein n=1 Tax=Streptacidiphilus neutrinimicus TaxID=105420 RepID=UPI0005A94CA2|nr:hypothetical protein [Streptacidiphilus neutrinimicus]